MEFRRVLCRSVPTAISSPILVPLLRPPPTFVAGPPGPSSIDHQIIAGAPRAAVRQFNAIALGEHRGKAAIAALSGAPVAHQLAVGFIYLEPEALRRVRIGGDRRRLRSEEHTSELQSLMRISYAVFCLKKKRDQTNYI